MKLSALLLLYELECTINLTETKNNYIMCIHIIQKQRLEFNVADVQLGIFYMTEVEGLSKIHR